MNKLMPLLALALVSLPAASAAPLLPQPTPDTLGHVLDAGLIHVTYTLNPSVDAGDVVPLCDDAPDVPQDRDVLGAIIEDCFQPTNHTASSGGPLDICDPVIVNLFPVGVAPDEECIEALGEWVQRIVSGGIPGHVILRLQE